MMDQWTIKLLITIAIFIKLSAYCADVLDIYKHDPEYGKTWMFFPNGEGKPQVIELIETNPNAKFSLAHENPDSKITLWLYNKKYKTNPKLLKVTGPESRNNFTIDKSYDSKKKTKFIIHGWQNNLNSPVIQLIKDAYLKESEDFNIVAVDWGKMAQDNNYLSSAASTKNVGKNVAAVIDEMVIKHKAHLTDFHIIGHSLGAHTAGYTGMYVTSGKVERITGLDPAYPGFFNSKNIADCLDPTDAEFVDVIHTCAGTLGHNQNLGHADFFPNAGKSSQPGCSSMSDYVEGCSHGRSYMYFAESIQKKYGFMSYPCDTWEEFQNKDYKSGPVPMGEALSKGTKGKFFLETDDGPTFARFNKIN